MAGEAGLQPNDIQRGRDELRALAPQLKDGAAVLMQVQGISPRKAAVAMLALARLVRDRGWRPRFEQLPAWSVAHLDGLEARALALHVLLMDLATAEAGSPGARVPVQLVRQAHQLRGRMLEVLEFGLLSAGAAQTELADIRSGSGHLDLQADLSRLAVLYRAHEVELTAELPRRFAVADADEAEGLAAEVLAALTDGLPPVVAALRLQVGRLFGHVAADYDQVVRGGIFLFWNEPERAHFVSLHAAARA